MIGPLAGLRAQYAAAFSEHLRDGGEGTLRSAYELGREALTRELSVLELAAVHHDVLLGALRGGPQTAVEEVVRAAEGFLVEALSAYEMAQRGFREAREDAAVERRHAEVLRRLSEFLAEASLALDAVGSREEALRLLAEQARELVDADCCLVVVARDTVGASSAWAGSSASAGALLRLADLPDVREALALAGGSARLAGAQLATHPVGAVVRAACPEDEVGAWMGALICGRDGRPLGVLQLTGRPNTAFGAVDEARVLHLAWMAAAALEPSRPPP